MSKIFYRVDITTTSPLSIGNGEDQYTDNDVLVDDDGNPFIPGTTIAGVLSSVLDDESRNALFSSGADIKDEDRKMSRVITYDAYCNNNPVIGKRDNVRLDENKTQVKGGKFDYQIIENGAEFKLLFELNGLSDDNIAIFESLIQSMKLEQISFGHKTTRGFGRFHVDHVAKKEFCQSDFEEYLNFDVFNWDGEEYIIENDSSSCLFKELDVELEQNGTLCIREYNPDPDGPDYMSITNGNCYCIPGTSWAGAFRSHITVLLKDLVHEDHFTYDKASSVIRQMFGYTDENDSLKSKISFSETILNGARSLRVDRVKIDRFTSGAVDSAKFDEVVVVNGSGTLRISINSRFRMINPAIALLMLALEDLNDGMLCVGGETSIGRGMFTVKNLEELKKQFDMKTCFDELAFLIRECRKGV